MKRLSLVSCVVFAVLSIFAPPESALLLQHSERDNKNCLCWMFPFIKQLIKKKKLSEVF